MVMHENAHTKYRVADIFRLKKTLLDGRDTMINTITLLPAARPGSFSGVEVAACVYVCTYMLMCLMEDGRVRSIVNKSRA